MRLQRYRGCLVLIGGVLICFLSACALLGLGVATHAIVLPSVLVHNDMLWVGDLCRATQSSAVQYMQQCSPGYTVDVIVYGRSTQHFTVVQIPFF